MTANIDPFHTIAISRLAHRLCVEGKSIIHMEFGQPSTGAPRAAISEAHRVLDEDGMGYWESPQLKQRIAQLYQKRYGVQVDPERIILADGAASVWFRMRSTMGLAMSVPREACCKTWTTH